MNKNQLLKPEKRMLKIGRYHLDISHIIIRRTTQAQDMCLELDKEINKGKLNSHYEVTSRTFDIVLKLVRIDFSFKSILQWFIRRVLITKKYLFKTLDYEEAESFIDKALSPIIESKKKELKKMERLQEAGLKLINAMEPEQLAKLLQNVASSMGGKAKVS